MNVQDFTYLLQHPDKLVSFEQSKELESIIEEYPYFQAARALHLKSLKNQNSFKYNNALKVTAAHTTDRDILFDFITSDEFLQNGIADSILGRTGSLVDKESEQEIAPPIIKKPVDLIEESEDKPLPRTLKDADHILDPTLFESKKGTSNKEMTAPQMDMSQDLKLGEPLPFTKKEKHSFSEWLQLASLKPVNREADKKTTAKKKDIDIKSISSEDELLKRKKFECIDKFLEDNPKIVPAELQADISIKESISFDRNELMTETLAKVYLEQKKFKKAIQAYKILSLKYPEKSGFFADRIKAVVKIQKENI